MELGGRNILVAGMERSGIASTELLLKHGARVTAADQKPLGEWSEAAQSLGARGVAFRLQSQGGFEDFDGIVISPGVPFDAPPVQRARDRGVPVIGEVELAAPFLKGRTIGITGSNGKTTTTALTGHILQESNIAAQVGGNIGTPVAAMVDSSRDGQWNVLELSSFQLETTFSFRPDVAVILNVTQNHLDRHHTLEAYAEAKARILDRQTSSDFAILNAEDAFCRSFAHRGAARRVWFSSAPDAGAGFHLSGDALCHGSEKIMPASEVPIRGRHNWENTLAAMAAAHLAGASFSQIANAIRSFQAVEHRLEFVRRLDNIDFYNDSKATSVDATSKALDAFEHGLWVILGGKDKDSDYAPLRAPLAAKASAALLIGSAAPKIEGQLQGAVRTIAAGTLDAAVDIAFRNAQSGDTILLAPACASFDQFQSYEHRGRAFKERVRALQPIEHGTKA